MQIKEYQELVSKMPLYDDPVYGLLGELGELIEPIKKSRRPYPRTKPYNRKDLEKEFGDVFWYLTRLADAEGFDVETILEQNIEKLTKRHELNESK